MKRDYLKENKMCSFFHHGLTYNGRRHLDHEEQKFHDGCLGISLRLSTVSLYLIVDSDSYQGLSSNLGYSADTVVKGWQVAQKHTLNIMIFSLIHQILYNFIIIRDDNFIF